MPLNIADTPTNTEAETFLNGLETTVGEHSDMLDGTAPIPSATIETATAERLVMASETLTYAGTVNIDFNTNSWKKVHLTGDVTFTTSNLTAGESVTLHITTDGTQRNMTFPAWGGDEFYSEIPTALAANGKAILVLFSSGTTDADVDAAYALRGGGSPVTTDGVQTLTNKTIPLVTKVASSNYTIGTDNALELYGGMIYATAAITLTIPAVTAGMSFTVQTIGAVAVSVDPNASDLLVRDGTAQADGEKVTNLSTAGDIAVFTYYDATGWAVATNGWTNGG